ncbi:hypothetical protein GTH52_06985 [Clostridium tyrobutyricum]|uniref:Conserved protein n=1 Tax=Clostridium tyrobutyricum DIVETGP TaxID=1408889 RepID=W6NH89_CLOTY|nr:hypothetical protein [Clostridium tyrobutyricum]AND84288.1 hypothetical protein CTK_C10270 [Clostridium tyrobutyricum]AND84372.1 hypothetical protein CTK_C11110 [Clostridium tyrobutyricum]ANP68999.1 hypothetical protein BA182_04720 [Clostridium tyrobutyricum]MBR9648752.1 hypothetical protein [Clostridium tyrobutyricum]MBV4432430.1 hypothetical protein [Clostridium tyrobutyricum]
MAVTEDFYCIEGNTSVKNLMRSIITEITQNAGIYKWDLVIPDSIDKVGAAIDGSTINLIADGSSTDKVQTVFSTSNQDDTCIIKATTSYGKTFYVKFSREPMDLSLKDKQIIKKFQDLHSYSTPNGSGGYYNKTRTDAEVLEIMAGENPDVSGSGYSDYVNAMTKGLAINNIRIQISDKLNAAGDDISIPNDIQKSYNYRLAWYRNLQSEIKDFLPVEYWITVTKDSINLVLRGDPSADVSPYNNYLTGYCYIGALKPIEDSAYTDDEYNFGITVSSDVEPGYSNPYGQRTATGITDVCMIANKIGMPYQPHYPGFYSTNMFMDKCNVEGSRWDHKKHQFSPITLVHPIDMERGNMINVLAGDGSNINDEDMLTYMRDTDSEENYKKFRITAPFNFLNNSVNPNSSIAIRWKKVAE